MFKALGPRGTGINKPPKTIICNVPSIQSDLNEPRQAQSAMEMSREVHSFTMTGGQN